MKRETIKPSGLLKLFKIFSAGTLVSLTGSLPFGVLNITALQISVQLGWKPAILFAIGIIIIELIYARLTLFALHFLQKNESLFTALQWASILLLFYLAINNFYYALHPKPANTITTILQMPAFFYGVLLSALNPMQIPFWLGWSSILISKKILLPKSSYYALYMCGIGLGTFIGLGAFIYFGQLLTSNTSKYQIALQWVVGAVLLLTALHQVYILCKRKYRLYGGAVKP